MLAPKADIFRMKKNIGFLTALWSSQNEIHKTDTVIEQGTYVDCHNEEGQPLGEHSIKLVDRSIHHFFRNF